MNATAVSYVGPTRLRCVQTVAGPAATAGVGAGGGAGGDAGVGAAGADEVPCRVTVLVPPPQPAITADAATAARQDAVCGEVTGLLFPPAHPKSLRRAGPAAPSASLVARSEKPELPAQRVRGAKPARVSKQVWVPTCMSYRLPLARHGA